MCCSRLTHVGCVRKRPSKLENSINNQCSRLGDDGPRVFAASAAGSENVYNAARRFASRHGEQHTLIIPRAARAASNFFYN